MAFRNNSIRNYFKPSLHASSSETPVRADRGKRNSARVDSIPTKTTDGDSIGEHLPELESPDQAPGETAIKNSKYLQDITIQEPVAIQSLTDRVINGSDESDSNSDSSVEDIYVALQQQSLPRYTSAAANGFKSSEMSRARNKRTRTLVRPSPSKPKYKFDMNELIEQAEQHKATEASALSMNAILDAADDDSQDNSQQAARDSILQSVIAEKEKDGVDPGKFLLAVKRTETTPSEKGWYFFDPSKESSSKHRSFLTCEKTNGWKAMLADPQSRNQVLLSGFARDMVALEGTLDKGLCRWMLDEICFECRNDLREAYCQVLEGMGEHMGIFMSRKVIRRLLENLGAKEAAFDTNEELKLISKDQSLYQEHDWTALAAVTAFIGRISKYLSIETESYIMCMLTRMCIDSVVIEDMNLLATVQKTMEQVCNKAEGAEWKTICQEICTSTFDAVKVPALQLQVLRCIPQTSSRVHALRRRLALAFFFGEAKYLSHEPYQSFDMNDVIEQLEKPRFKINKDTDYPELAAVMSILNIAIDNGLSARHNITDPEGEAEFNREVDILAGRIKHIWGSINDAGASFMSRSYAKEMMEGLRMRLELTIRTKPKTKLSIFEAEEPDEDKIVLKQTTLSRKLFQRKPEDEGIV